MPKNRQLGWRTKLSRMSPTAATEQCRAAIGGERPGVPTITPAEKLSDARSSITHKAGPKCARLCPIKSATTRDASTTVWNDSTVSGGGTHALSSQGTDSSMAHHPPGNGADTMAPASERPTSRKSKRRHISISIRSLQPRTSTPRPKSML